MKVELTTNVGKFKFDTNDSKLQKKLNSLKMFKFKQGKKTITLFYNLLATAKLRVL